MKKRLLSSLLAVLFFVAQGYAQQRTVSGTVTAVEDGSPLPGVSVKNKTKTAATATNLNGKFNINAAPGDVLVFTAVGTITQEITVGASSEVNVRLKADQRQLSEVVITAYGIERNAKSLGYSTPRVAGDEVTQTGRENFINGLNGRVPGLSVNQTTGDPGASSQIVLRGFVSISGDNQPLIVVDGVPVDNTVPNQNNLAMNGNNRSQDYTNRAADINPADIESYTIMKGPEATALYGSQGASGAIIIVTKKGKAGKASVSYNTSIRVETVNNGPEVQQEFSQGDTYFVNDPSKLTYFGPRYSEKTKIYDNIGAFFETGIAQKHNLIFEGGKDAFTYRWSNEYVDNKGTIPTTRYRRLVSSLSSTAALNDKMKLTTRFSYTNAYNKKANKGAQGYVMGLLLFPSRFDINDWISPTGGRITRNPSQDKYTEADNPFWDVYKNLSDDRTNSLFANSNFNYKPTKWLTVNGILGTNMSITDGQLVYHADSYSGSGSAASPTGGAVNISQILNKRLDGSITATAQHKFGKFNNTYIIGANFADVNNTTNSSRGTQMIDPNFYSINNTLNTTRDSKEYVSRYRNAGAFVQTVLGYQELLYLTLSVRGDAASRLRPNNPYFAYPSASLAFNFSDLKALKDVDWLSSGKLRASYGLTGKEPYRIYALATRLLPAGSTGGGYQFDLASGGNPNLVPEQTRNFETGIEMSVLKDRFSVDFSYYRLNSHKQIINPRLSYGTGSVLRIMNGGDVLNRGAEVQLKGAPIRSKNINWDMTLNFTKTKGTVLSISDELPEFYESDAWIGNGVRSAVYPGASVGALGGWVNLRNDAGDLIINPQNGLPLLKSDADFYPIGDRIPKFTLGFVNNFNYKQFTISATLTARVGGDVYNQTGYELYRKGLSVKTLDRETPRVIKGVLRDGLENTANPTPNNIAITPAITTAYYTSTTTSIAPDMFVEKDVNAIRLNDITLGYSLSQKMIGKIKFIKNLGVYVTLTDVFLITNYSGMDPDVNGNNPGLGGIGGVGIDYGNMGRPLGVNMGFRIKL